MDIMCNVVTMPRVSLHCVLPVLPCLVPGTAASAILVPASALLQQIQREKNAVLQLQAETRKNMRRHFSVHNISFIAQHQGCTVCTVFA